MTEKDTSDLIGEPAPANDERSGNQPWRNARGKRQVREKAPRAGPPLMLQDVNNVALAGSSVHPCQARSYFPRIRLSNFRYIGTTMATNTSCGARTVSISRDSLLHTGERLPPSANPAEMFINLRAATMDRPDWHDKNVRDWKTGMKDRAIRDAAAGKISPVAEKEIVFLVDNADARLWRPLLYVINRIAVVGRLEEVPIAERASAAMEFRLADLRPPEFDIVMM